MSKKSKYLVAMAAFFCGFVICELGREHVYAQAESKAPKWSHGMLLRSRKADEADFNKDTKKFGVEVFMDENNGNLIYVSETGDISVVKK